MKTCVFVGPSSGDVALPTDIDRYTPAVCGSVWRAVELGYLRIVVVDGLFGDVPAVWHKEVLYALSRGIHVLGASGMGALRAAELARYGMVGVGAVFRFVRAGLIADDDEVFVSHAGADQGFAPRSLAMVAIRRTLSRLVRLQHLERAVAEGVCRTVKQLYFPERRWERLRAIFASAAPRGARAFEAFRRLYVDLGAVDYQEAIDTLERSPGPFQRPVWADLQTRMWQTQFVDQARDIPALQRW